MVVFPVNRMIGKKRIAWELTRYRTILLSEVTYNLYDACCTGKKKKKKKRMQDTPANEKQI